MPQEFNRWFQVKPRVIRTVPKHYEVKKIDGSWKVQGTWNNVHIDQDIKIFLIEEYAGIGIFLVGEMFVGIPMDDVTTTPGW